MEGDESGPRRREVAGVAGKRFSQLVREAISARRHADRSENERERKYIIFGHDNGGTLTRSVTRSCGKLELLSLQYPIPAGVRKHENDI